MFGPASSSATSAIPRECTFPEGRWTALARQWHPVALSDEVAEKPLGVVLLDQCIVLWRVAGSVSVAQDLCIHRGAQLSPGTIIGNELVCPYHGFRYAASGACTLAPCTGSPLTPLPGKLHLRMYASAVESGMIWVRVAPGGPIAPLVLGFPAEGAMPSFAQLWKAPARSAVECLVDMGRFTGGPTGWNASPLGPFSGVISDAPTGDPVAAFAVQPLSTARCRILVVGPAAKDVGQFLERARAIIESLPAEAGHGGESLLPGDRPIISYRDSLAALGLE